MIVPNKAVPYTESLLSRLPLLIQYINQEITLVELFDEAHSLFNDTSQFVLALDTLFVLKRIDCINGVIILC